MYTVKASEFKAKCLKMIDQVAISGEGVVITKNGKPMAQLSPFRQRPQSLYGALKHMMPAPAPARAKWNQAKREAWKEMEGTLGKEWNMFFPRTATKSRRKQKS